MKQSQKDIGELEIEEDPNEKDLQRKLRDKIQKDINKLKYQEKA